MKRKELKDLAKKIAAVQMKYDKSTDSQEKRELEQALMVLTDKVEDINDLMQLDDMVQDILEAKH